MVFGVVFSECRPADVPHGRADDPLEPRTPRLHVSLPVQGARLLARLETENWLRLVTETWLELVRL